MKKTLVATAILSTPLVATLSFSAHAGSYVDSFVTSANNPAVCGAGVPPAGGNTPCINTYQDEDRDMFADMNNNGIIDSGDINFGYAQLDTRTTPFAAPFADGAAIVAFALEVDTVTTVDNGDGTDPNGRTDTITFKAVTNQTAIDYGLDLAGLTGDATQAGQLISVYSDVGFAPLTASPGDVNGDGALNVLDWMLEIGTTGILEETAGLVENGDFWQFVGTSPGGSTTTVDDITLLESLTSGAQINATTDFNAGLEIIMDPAGYTKEELLVSAISQTTHEFLVTGGTVSGGSDLLVEAVAGDPNTLFNPFFLRVNDGDSCTGFPTAGCVPDGGDQNSAIINIYGASSNTDVSQVPVARIPEPATLGLLGFGLAGLSGFARRNRRKKV